MRTNFFRGDATLAFKFDPAGIPELPLPRPAYEIWVCGPRVEGVHLRGGPIARGGLRWSDRREDFRTEVLGLMKAQMVKNAVIVPTGAKGGFVVKRPLTDPEAAARRGRRLLPDVRRGDARSHRQPRRRPGSGGAQERRVVHPPDTVVHDGDDTYLVVAADKGTASFSDIANTVSREHGFWLGDAFASGGSVGYDHKAMGITARGAWESVRRHARSLGRNADADPLTGGRHRRHVRRRVRQRNAAIEGAPSRRRLRPPARVHRPRSRPGPVACAERARLFALPRSSWADYDTELISPGGGVYARTLKSIDLSTQARAALGITSVDDADARPSRSRPCSRRLSTCCGTVASART